MWMDTGAAFNGGDTKALLIERGAFIKLHINAIQGQRSLNHPNSRARDKSRVVNCKK